MRKASERRAAKVGDLLYIGRGAALDLKGRSVGAVMPLRSSLGSARICLDPRTAGMSCRTIDLSPSSGTGARKVVFARNGLGVSTPHTVVVTRLSGWVELDAVVVLG